jgi:ubiquinone/menaquinone biosynthesis C-methylase UbiE
MGAMGAEGEAERLNQFARPHGAMGRVVGGLMAAINSDMERCAVDALGLHGTESALEIGFGPGVGVARLARRLRGGRVAGIDPSVVMLTQASRRNRRAIREGRVELREGTASCLPCNDGWFDAVVSVNNIREWPNLSGDLAEIRRVLTPRGRLSIAVHAWVDKYAKDRGEPNRPWGEHLATAVEHAGFTDVVVRHGRAMSGRALYLVADVASQRDPEADD